MASGPGNFYTAAQIGAALRLSSKGSILRQVQGVESVTIIVRGQKAQAWQYDRLPANLRARLEAEAIRLGYRTVFEFISDPKTPWTPALPLARIAQPCIDRAALLQRALQPMLAKRNDISISEAEFNRQGIAQYKAVFGHDVSEKHWRRLFERTVERDRGLEDFERLEIYLDERVTPKVQDSEADAEFEASAHHIAQLVTSFKNSAAPEPHEEALLWDYVFEHYTNRIFFGESARRIKPRLVKFLAKQTPYRNHHQQFYQGEAAALSS
jgi:hypothetical protein